MDFYQLLYGIGLVLGGFIVLNLFYKYYEKDETGGDAFSYRIVIGAGGLIILGLYIIAQELIEVF